MFNLPAETFWLLVPWPFIWMAAGLFMYFKMRKEDLREEQSE
jgi:hypothetical protein